MAQPTTDSATRTIDGLADAGEELKETLRKNGSRIANTATDTAQRQIKAFKDMTERGRETVEDFADDVRDHTRDNPLRTIGIAFAAGAAVALLASFMTSRPKVTYRS